MKRAGVINGILLLKKEMKRELEEMNRRKERNINAQRV